MNIALIIYNRPDQLKRVWASICQAKPERLFLIADGPKDIADKVDCDKAREVVAAIPWPCKVERLYSDTNLGCSMRLPTGLDWVFEKVDDCIILEDDCLPDPSFFPFCQELLRKYRTNDKVACIGGTTYGHNADTKENCFFSRYPSEWGWATWKRAWKFYDHGMTRWFAFMNERRMRTIFRDEKESDYWTTVLNLVYLKKFESWASKWYFACWEQGGLSVVPDRNLVSNIGFGKKATHTREASSPLANIPTVPMTFPLVVPSELTVDSKRDKERLKAFFRFDEKI